MIAFFPGVPSVYLAPDFQEASLQYAKFVRTSHGIQGCDVWGPVRLGCGCEMHGFPEVNSVDSTIMVHCEEDGKVLTRLVEGTEPRKHRCSHHTCGCHSFINLLSFFYPRSCILLLTPHFQRHVFQLKSPRRCRPMRIPIRMYWRCRYRRPRCMRAQSRRGGIRVRTGSNPNSEFQGVPDGTPAFATANLNRLKTG
jgi:hypothetical protein